MTRRTKAEQERVKFGVSKMIDEGKTCKEICDAFYISSSQFYSIRASLKKNGISLGDMGLFEQYEADRERYKVIEAKQNLICEAMRRLDEPLQKLIKEAMLQVKRDEFEKERQEQIEAINNKYDRMIEEGIDLC